jgi:hypothetical protein
MRTRSLLLLCMIPVVSVAWGQTAAAKKSKAAPVLTCTAISEGLLSDSHPPGIHLPIALAVELEVDLPIAPGGVVITPVSLQMSSKSRLGNQPWLTCQAGVACGNAIFDARTSLGFFGHADADGARTYGSLVKVTPGWSAETYVRLALTYTVKGGGPECVSQQSWEINANSIAPMALTIPDGKTFDRYATYASELPPRNDVGWHQCDTSGGVTDACLPSNPGAIGFSETPINDLGADPGGQLQGYENRCNNSHGTLRRACRAQVAYK